jgi:hypothetical protein
MGKMYTHCLLCIALIGSLYSSAQIVNIEASRMQSDTTGWMGGAKAGVVSGQEVNHIFGANVGLHLQYKTQKNLWLILGNYNFYRGGHVKYTDNSFFHLRFNRKLNTWLRWEIFAQAQNNLITQLKARILVGTGPRFKIVSTKVFRLYAATLAMYEREKEKTSPTIKHNDMRSSSYVSFTIIPVTGFEIISTTFYQPLFSKISDYRILNEATLKVQATKHFGLSMSWEYLHDRFPAGTAPRTTYSFSSGVNFDF